MTGPILFVKAYVPPHLRGGHQVKGYHRRDRQGHGQPAKVVHHPELDHHGEPVKIHQPSTPTPLAAFGDPKAVATIVPGGEVPAQLHGVLFEPWSDHPTTAEGWDYVDGVNDDLDEPPMHAPKGKAVASGVVIEEPDGRVWLVAPTNGFGGYKASFPKGNAEPELSLQANAIKEAFEETGLKVEITGLVGDFERTTSVARLYLAKRVGGTPARMGWESQAVHLAPKDKLYGLLNMATDHGPAEAIGAGPKPPPPPKPPAQAYPKNHKSGMLF